MASQPTTALTEIRRRLAGASPGPWRTTARVYRGQPKYQVIAVGRVIAHVSPSGPHPDGDLALIGAAHDDITDLLNRLDAIADLLEPCPPPDIFGGFDQCACGNGVWPCKGTRAAWLARGLDVGVQARTIIEGLRPPPDEW